MLLAVKVGPLLGVAVVLAAAVGVAEGVADVLAVLVPDVLVVLLLPQLAWQTSDRTVRAGSSSTSCRSISTSLSASYMKSS
ncbi:MAG TPA: hypothetical protein VFA63_01420 [Pseudonocardiaceae bacterium]|nr:hypothetical protein [Pseudonocardiaceae bacterium]